MTSPPSRDAERPVVLVTGGARRVGRAVALRLAKAGWDVAITYRRSGEDALATVEELGSLGANAIAIAVDLEQADAADRVHEQFCARFDRLDALVNNAAIFAALPLQHITPAEYDRYQAVNARAPLMLTRRFADLLAQRHRQDDPASTGRVVNFVDIHVMGQPMSQHTAYNASKAALLEITRSCAVELGPAVTVNAVAPGVVAWAEQFTPEQRRDYLARVPLGRAGTVEDAAEVVRWLICAAHYCTGQVIRVDGGRLLR